MPRLPRRRHRGRQPNYCGNGRRGAAAGPALEHPPRPVRHRSLPPRQAGNRRPRPRSISPRSKPASAAPRSGPGAKAFGSSAGVAVLVLAVAGGWGWYAFAGSKPHLAASLKLTGRRAGPDAVSRAGQNSYCHTGGSQPARSFPEKSFVVHPPARASGGSLHFRRGFRPARLRGPRQTLDLPGRPGQMFGPNHRGDQTNRPHHRPVRQFYPRRHHPPRRLRPG